jgi:hypothetical protein
MGIEPTKPLLAQSFIGFEDRGRHQSGTRFHRRTYTESCGPPTQCWDAQTSAPFRCCVHTPSLALSIRQTSATRSQTSTGSPVVPVGLVSPVGPHAPRSSRSPRQRSMFRA